MRQVTFNLEEQDFTRLEALRIPARPGEPIPNLSVKIREALTIGIKALEDQREKETGHHT